MKRLATLLALVMALAAVSAAACPDSGKAGNTPMNSKSDKKT